MQNGLKFLVAEGELVACLSGEIDHHVAREVREGIDARLFAARPGVLTLDFSGVHFMDSSGIALILGRAEICGEIGCRVKITGLSRGLLKLVMLSGIPKIKNLTIE